MIIYDKKPRPNQVWWAKQLKNLQKSSFLRWKFIKENKWKFIKENKNSTNKANKASEKTFFFSWSLSWSSSCFLIAFLVKFLFSFINSHTSDGVWLFYLLPLEQEWRSRRVCPWAWWCPPCRRSHPSSFLAPFAKNKIWLKEKRFTEVKSLYFCSPG